MEGDDDGTPINSDAFAKSTPPGAVEREQETVDHHIADEDDLLRGLALAPQRLVRIARRREEQIGKAVGDNTVDLLWHPAIVAP
jgi:hypothetical protein